MTAKQIKDQWSASGKEASEAGTAMHLGIEQFHNSLKHCEALKLDGLIVIG